MYLKDQQSGDLVEVLSIDKLIDPCQETVTGRLHAGEELQDSSEFSKNALRFPSGEVLPRCWLDKKYRIN